MNKLLVNTLAGLMLMSSATASADKPNADVNFAFGGAQTGSGNLTAAFVPDFPVLAGAQGLVVPGLAQQLDWAEATVTDIKSKKDLFWLYAGTNDLLGAAITGADLGATLGSMAANMGGALERLHGMGAKIIVVPNLIPVGKLPILAQFGVPPAALAGLNDLTSYYNAVVLPGAIAQFQAAHPDVSVVQLNVEAIMAGIQVGEDGWVNTTGSCVDESLPFGGNCDGWVFLDNVHPTTEVYELWAEAAYQAVRTAVVAGDRRKAKDFDKGRAIRRIITLGDSFSDTGSFNYVWNTGMGAVGAPPFLPDPPFWQGRFSNHFNVIDWLEDMMRVKVPSTFYAQ